MQQMRNLEIFANQFDPRTCACRAFVETPKGSRYKYSYDPDGDVFSLSKLLPAGMSFPFDFGFIPSTRGGDGDPLDVLILMDEPGCVGCQVDIAIIGVVCGKQKEKGKSESNDRLLATSRASCLYRDITSAKQLNASLKEEIEEFLVFYKKLKGGDYKITDWGGPKRAIEVIKAGIKAHGSIL